MSRPVPGLTLSAAEEQETRERLREQAKQMGVK